MRKKDWADEVAEEFYDTLAADIGDEGVVQLIGEKLRKAFSLGLGQLVLTDSWRQALRGERTRYIVTVARGSRVAAIRELDLSQLSDEARAMLTYTWDGEPSKKEDDGSKEDEEDDGGEAVEEPP